MPVSVTCTCGKALKIPEQYAGKRVKCPQCGTGIRVPTSPSVSTPTPPPASRSGTLPTLTPPAAVPPGMVRFTCPCGKQMQARAQFAGRLTQCPACGKQLPIPAESEAPPAPAAPRG